MSLTIIGIIVAVLAKIADIAGFHGSTVTTENLTQLVTVGGQIVGILLAYYGRVRKGDVDYFGRRLKSDVTIDSLPQ